LKYFPINLNLTNRPCLVVGGGEVGQRKIETLLECGAEVRLVSRELAPALQDQVKSGRVRHIGPEFSENSLDGVFLVMAATNDGELNALVSREAEKRGLWVNVADQPDLCSFILPAVVSQGDLTISVSTSGRSPAMASKIRDGLEDEFGPEYGRFLDIMGLIRGKLLAEGHPPKENREVFKRLVQSEILDSLAAGNLENVDKLLMEILVKPGYSLSELEDWRNKETGA
jgi:precorrin-2 dehydrogenase/sirohydrochlorin ferrochelatase